MVATIRSGGCAALLVLAVLCAPHGVSAQADASPRPSTHGERLACAELELAIGSRTDRLKARAAELDREDGELREELKQVGAEASQLDRLARDQHTAFGERRQRSLARSAALAEGARQHAAAAAEVEQLNRLRDKDCGGTAGTDESLQALRAEFVGSAGPAAAARFNAGVTAFDHGQHGQAFALWLPLAAQGDAAAQFNVAALYEQGLGVPTNEAQAARWYLRAAEGGDIVAQAQVGRRYEAGRGVDRDAANAGRWYGRAAAGAPTDAQAQAAIKQAREGLSRLRAQRANVQAVYSFYVGRFVLMVSPDRHCVIALQGSVARSAIDKFDEALAGAAAERCAEPLTLVLESPGGDFFTGLWLGHRVRARGMHTVSRYPCASSCASIFLGGVDRVLWGQRATLGFHQASTSEKVDRGSGRSCIQEDSDPLMLELRSYLTHMVPETSDRLFELMMGTTCWGMKWLAGADALTAKAATRLEDDRTDVFGSEYSRRGSAAGR